MIECMQATVSINNQPTVVMTPDDSVVVNISFICGIVLPTVRDPALRDLYVKLVSQLVVLMQRKSWYKHIYYYQIYYYHNYSYQTLVIQYF